MQHHFCAFWKEEQGCFIPCKKHFVKSNLRSTLQSWIHWELGGTSRIPIVKKKSNKRRDYLSSKSTRYMYLFRWEGLAKGADFALTATPFAACIRQSNYHISPFPVNALQSLQHLFWDRGASRAEKFCGHWCQIHSLVTPCMAISRTLLVGRMRDVICVPGEKCFFSK